MKSKCCNVNESRFGTCANCGLPFEPREIESPFVEYTFQVTRKGLANIIRSYTKTFNKDESLEEKTYNQGFNEAIVMCASVVDDTEY